ncbi:hypothetical protein BW723_14995 [Polaribacter reichenbachii]|uniref:SPOR domain-containing protein n=1 Tax=Polaribacter reichenbachii TaxID=996801 RepID=A0A1B8U4I2_9FLAO|nr:hypothetical protein [Polaribacter reichenbachii]APZ47513.1 hypothetical protein BW723_14995 [Polaribacter reichenbachii]AUC18152.1 hypothetical protein BTO17_05435 [Polaribacter reichenbachii]OBY66763.1 hypothetical protein LPB301_06065 [Polaribacter reichenbachii]
MPLIKEEVLNELYSELDRLKTDKEKLQTGFVDLKLKSNQQKKANRRNIIILIVAIILLVFLSIYLYLQHSNSQSVIETKEQKIVTLLNRINSESKPKTSNLKSTVINPDVIYTIQLGVFEKLDLDISTKENFSFKEIENKEKRIYQLGVFSSYTTATLFKEEIKKIGLEDAFIVPYNKESDRIDIKKALVLSNEEFYIKE